MSVSRFLSSEQGGAVLAQLASRGLTAQQVEAALNAEASAPALSGMLAVILAEPTDVKTKITQATGLSLAHAAAIEELALPALKKWSAAQQQTGPVPALPCGIDGLL